MDLNRKMLTVAEVASVLKVHTSTVYRMLKNGQIRSKKIGSDHRFLPEELDRLINDGVNKVTQ